MKSNNIERNTLTTGKRDLEHFHAHSFEPGKTKRLILICTSSVFSQYAAWHWMLFPTRSIGFPNRITNSPDHRLASRKFFSFWPGARTFPITDFHLDHCIEKWNAFGWGSDQFHISHLLKNYWFLYAFFCETVFCLSFLYWLAAGTAIVHSTILQLFMNPFDREID